MKKIYLLALVAMVAISAVATVQPRKYDTKSIQRISHVPFKEFTKSMSTHRLENALVYSNGQVPSVAKARKATADAALDTAYYVIHPDDGLYSGFAPDGGMMRYPILWQRANADVEFINLSMFNEGGEFGWFYYDVNPDYLLSADTDMVISPADQLFVPGDGYDFTPIFGMESGAQYAYGDAQEAQYWYAFDPDFYTPLTKSHIYTSTAFNPSGYDVVCYYYDEQRPYYLGTGLQFGENLFDSIGTPWGFEGCTTKIDSISILVASRGASTLKPGNKLTMSHHPVISYQGTNYIFLDTAYVRYTATTQDIMWQEYDSDYDETMGGITFPIKKDIKGLFFICITGFNGRGANIGLYSDGLDGYGIGDTYFIGAGGNFIGTGVNALISVNALIEEPEIPTALDKVAEQAVKVKKEIRNGQLIITRGEKSFNVLGAQL